MALPSNDLPPREQSRGPVDNMPRTRLKRQIGIVGDVVLSLVDAATDPAANVILFRRLCAHNNIVSKALFT